MWFNGFKSNILGLLFICQIVFVCSGMFGKKLKDYSTLVIQNVNSGKNLIKDLICDLTDYII